MAFLPRVPLVLPVLVLAFAEIAVFILVGQAIGVLATLALVFAAMVAGVVLLRRQGMTMLARARDEAAAGRVPARALADGTLIGLGAVLMIVPGFITDLIGAALFVPAVRTVLCRRLGKLVAARGATFKTARSGGVATVELGRSDYTARERQDSPWIRDGRQDSRDGPAL